MMKEYKVTGNKDTRSGFGAGLVEAGRRNKDVVALCADLTGSVKMDLFAQEFPERMIQCGIAEADMIGIAAGLLTTATRSMLLEALTATSRRTASTIPLSTGQARRACSHRLSTCSMSTRLTWW